MKKTFKIATIGRPDSQNDILMPGCIKQKNVVLTKNFDKTTILGHAEIEEGDGEVYATADIQEQDIGMYPAIGFKYLDVKMNEEGFFEINNMELIEVSLCKNPNADPSVNPI